MAMLKAFGKTYGDNDRINRINAIMRGEEPSYPAEGPAEEVPSPPAEPDAAVATSTHPTMGEQLDATKPK